MKNQASQQARTGPALVDYSDSDSEAENPPPLDVPVAPSPETPETENELARIVIELQRKYIRELEEVNFRQEEVRREMRDQNEAIEKRWETERELLRGVVEHVYGIDVKDLVTMRDLQLFSSRSKSVDVPPHPSHSPSVSVPAHIPSQSQASRLPTLSRVELPPIKHAIGGAEESISIVTSTTTLPQRIISTGKKAPRSKGASNHRSYQPGKKSTAAYASKQTTHSRPAARKNTVREEIKASHIAKRRLELPQNISTNKERPTVEPQNPYDDPKYFSPLTVLTEDGTKQPIFKFHQHPDTVEEQWAEYKYGLHGQPPVEQLEAKYRAKWRNNDYGRSWFTRRKPFWDKIKEAMAEGKTEAEALNMMRDLANGRVKSLIGQLCDERASKRRRLEKMQKGRSRASRKKWSEARKEEVVDSAEEESVGADSKTNAVVLRKRIKQFKAWAGVDESESDTISKKDADELWSE